MKPFCVGAADKITHRRHGSVGYDFDCLNGADRPDITGLGAEVFKDFCFTGKTECTQSLYFAGLDFIELMIAAQQ